MSPFAFGNYLWLTQIKPILIVSFWHSSLLHQSAHSCENCTHWTHCDFHLSREAISAMSLPFQHYFFFYFFVITNWQWHEWREIFNLNKRRRQRSFRRLLLLFLGSRAVVVCIVGWLWSELICEEKAKCQLNFGTVERRDIDHRHKENM